MKEFIETIPYILLIAWLIFSIYYLNVAKRTPDKINPYIFESIPQIFPTIGILGTFIGIAYGLWLFDVNTHLPKGIYVARLSGSHGTETLKLMLP